MPKSIAHRVDLHVGLMVRKRRAELGMTQNDLAQVLGLSYQQVQKYEAGANRISAGKLYELASLLKTDVAWFYEGLDPSSKAPAVKHGGYNRTSIELVRNLEELRDPELTAQVAGLVKSLVGRLRDQRSS
jgi:transcriptional regulator with XRE-family HTH domain